MFKYPVPAVEPRGLRRYVMLYDRMALEKPNPITGKEPRRITKERYNEVWWLWVDAECAHFFWKVQRFFVDAWEG